MEYDAGFACTYHLLNKDEYDDSLILYQLQFLQAFKLDPSQSFDDKKVNDTTMHLYELYKNNEYIKELIDNRKKKMGGLDDFDIFRTYFGYDTFYLFHSILSRVISEKPIDLSLYDKLLLI